VYYHVEATWKRKGVEKEDLMNEGVRRGGRQCGSGTNMKTGERDCCCYFFSKKKANAYARWLKKQHLRVVVIG
jgi:hypothetical protein